MSALTVLRRGRLAGAVIPALALGIAGLIAAPAGAQAAARTPALHTGHKVSLGSTTNVINNTFTQAPDGSVYFSSGSTVSVVRGSSKRTVLHAGKKVLALAANNSDLFVQTGLTVTEYKRSDSGKVRQWTLPKQPAPITLSGLISVGSTLWSWSTIETDGSGFEFAWVSRIATSSAAVHLVTKWADWPFMSADSAGLYFEGTNSSQSKYYLGHASPSGALTLHSQPALRFAPFAMTISSGKIVVLQQFPVSHYRINTYSPTSLALLSSKPTSSATYQITGTSAGLVALGQVCKQSGCSTPTISKLDVATGALSGAVKVPGAFSLLAGSSAVLLDVSNYPKGTMSLQRISS